MSGEPKITVEPKIKGYRELSNDELEILDQIKCLDKNLGESFQKLHDIIAGDLPNPDWRWFSIAKTHFQEGFMALARSVACPEDWYGN